MDLKFLGTGGAFDFEYGNSAAWVELNGKSILLDCGHSVYHSLRSLELADKIDYILITHLHDDHVGSLSTVILHHKHMRWPSQKARILYPPTPNGEKLKESIKDFLSFSLLEPEKYLDFIPIESESGIGYFDTTGMHVKGLITFGYYFENDKEILVYSGDIGDQDYVFDMVDAFPPTKKTRIFHEASFFPTNGVHTFYKDLHSRLGKYDFYAYHNDPRRAPEDNEIPLVADHKEFFFKD